jgi:S-(hydroxymethyl)glutathione dehydrogenase/alcohol dehydrogenase
MHFSFSGVTHTLQESIHLLFYVSYVSAPSALPLLIKKRSPTMKAAVLYEYGKPLSIQEVELDAPNDYEIHVKVGAAGICRSDLHFMRGEAHIDLPAVLGHEGAGTVINVGKAVTRVNPGDRVIMSFVSSCGHCTFCLTGRSNICDLHGATGPYMFDNTTRLHQGSQRIAHMGKVACFAEEVIVPESGCIPIDDVIPFPQAALIGCSVTTGVGAAMYTAKISPGSTVAVFGSGGVGLNIIQGARLLNAAKIIAIDINEGKLEFATKFGATHTINPTQQDTIERVREITNGMGADYTFEAFGAAETASDAFISARKGGTVVIVGIAPLGDIVGVDLVSLVRQEKTIKGCYYGSSRPNLDISTMVALYHSGKIDIDSLITREYKLEEVNQAYQDLESGEIGRGVITQF